MRIPEFRREVFPTSVNTGAISAAGATARAIGGVSDTLSAGVSQLALQRKQARDANAVNEASVEFEKKAKEAESVFRKEREKDPIGAAKAFDSILEDSRSQFIEQLPSRAAKDSFTRLSNDYRGRIFGKMQTFESNQQVVNFGESLEKTSQNLNTMAFRSGDMNEFPEILAKAEAAVVAGETFLSGEQVAKLKANLRENVGTSFIEGVTIQDPQAAINALDAGKMDGVLDPTEIVRLRKNAVSAKRAAKAEANLEQQRKLVAAGTSVQSVIDRLQKGYEIPEDEMESVKNVVKLSGDAKAMKKFKDANDTRQFISYARRLSPSQLDEVINTKLVPAAQKDGATNSEFMMLQTAQKLLDNTRTAIKTDPLTAANNSGIVPLEPISIAGLISPNPEDVQTTESQLRLRQSHATTVAQHYQIEPKFFTQQEASAISQTLKKMNPQQKLAFSQGIADSLGDDFDTAIQELGREDPVYAHAAGLAKYATGSAIQIMQGQQVMDKNPDFVKDVLKDSTARETFNDEVGDVFQLMPETAQSVKNAADALYVQKRFSKGASGFDDSDYRDAINEALGGGIGKVGGWLFDGVDSHKIILPPQTTGSDMTSFLNNLNAQDLTDLSVGGGPAVDRDGKPIENISKLVGSAVLHTVGNGQYAFYLPRLQNYVRGSGPNGIYVMKVNANDVERVNNR